jgi:PhnB protein
MSKRMSNLMPHLIVKGAARAIDWYVEALGAKELARFVDQKLAPGGVVVHADLEVRGEVFTLAEENPEWHNVSPKTLGGNGTILTLTVDDADAVGARMVELGGEVVFPIADQFYGARQGRIRDPFGHLWIVSQVKEELSQKEIQRRVDRFHDK